METDFVNAAKASRILGICKQRFHAMQRAKKPVLPNYSKHLWRLTGEKFWKRLEIEAIKEARLSKVPGSGIAEATDTE